MTMLYITSAGLLNLCLIIYRVEFSDQTLSCEDSILSSQLFPSYPLSCRYGELISFLLRKTLHKAFLNANMVMFLPRLTSFGHFPAPLRQFQTLKNNKEDTCFSAHLCFILQASRILLPSPS